MKDLIEALTIFAKYQPDTYAPTHCEHDVMLVAQVSEDEVSAEDRKRLDVLGWHWNGEYACWASFRFGSA